jgi:hypothetical protein
MTSHRKILLADLIIDSVLSTFIFVYATIVVKNLKIRLNIGSKIRWVIVLMAIVLRLALTCWDYCTMDYNVTSWRLYLLWAIEQAHFMIILMLFFSVIGSWHIATLIR